MTEDIKIIELFYARKEQAIAEVSDKYGAACKAVAKNILKNELDAEECVNDAYLALWNSIPPEKPDPLRSYLFKVVRNISVAKYHTNTSLKRNSYYDTALEELEDCLAAPVGVQEEITAEALSRSIDAFLDTLSKHDRVMFVRRYWYSDSVSELAGRFCISQNNISVRLSRIRDKLKKHLEKEGFEI